jgi:hypothetical protein
MPAQIAAAAATYHAGRRLWQVRQRVRIQLARRSQLWQVIEIFCDTSRTGFSSALVLFFNCGHFHVGPQGPMIRNFDLAIDT